MDLKWYAHTDASRVRPLLLDMHDEVYAHDLNPLHTRERFAHFVDLWSGRDNWSCVSGWEDDGPVGYAYGAAFKPGGWWKGARRPRDVRGRIFALSELMVLPRWQGTGRAQPLHDALVQSTGADFVTLLVDATHPKVRALYEKWGYEQREEFRPADDAPPFAVMVRALRSA